MPFYEYQCNACGHHLEVLQKISDEPLQFCPECGGGGLRKLVSKSAFRLKGGGWYETDFKHGDAKKSAGGDGDGGDGDKSAGGKKSAEKSPDSKTDSGKSSEPKSKTQSKKSA